MRARYFSARWLAERVTINLTAYISSSHDTTSIQLTLSTHRIDYAKPFNSICPLLLERKPRRNPARRPDVSPERRSERGRGRNLTLSTSTRSSSRSTLILVSAPRVCPSWTPSSTTSSRESLVKLPDLDTTTRGRPSHPERCRPLSGFSYPVNWLNMLCLKAPRPSPSTLHPLPNRMVQTCELVVIRYNKLTKKAFFKATNNQKGK